MTLDLTLILAILLFVVALAVSLHYFIEGTNLKKAKKIIFTLAVSLTSYLFIKTLISNHFNGFGYVEPFFPILEINVFEILFLLIALFITFLYLRKNIKSHKILLVLMLFELLFLYISIEKSSQLLASDEGISVMEYASVKYAAQMGVWGNGALRFSYITIGVLLSLFKPSDFYSLLSVAKMLHWLGGILLLFIIFNLIKKYILKIQNEKNFSIIFVIFMLFSLVTPMNLIALKIAQYDLYSMYLATIAILLLGISYLDKNLKFATIALVVSVVGSQEKLNVSPLIVVSLILIGFLTFYKYKKIYFIPVAILSGAIASILIILLMYGIIGAARDLHFPTKGTVSIIYPLVSWGWPLVSAKIGSNLAYFNTYSYFFLAALIVISIICAVILKIVNNKIEKINSDITAKVALVVVFLALAIGIWGTFNTQAYEGIFVQAPVGTYGHEKNPATNYTWYPGARNFSEFTIKNIAFYYAVFINAIPTIFWIILLFIFIYERKNHKPKGFQNSFIWDLAVIVCFLAPLGYAVTSTWLVNRYFDLFIYIFEIYVLFRLYNLVSTEQSFPKKLLLVSLSTIFLITEILPFAPVYAAFRPIWSNQSDDYQKNFVQGRMDVSWQGWGEEIMIAQREIFKKCIPTNNCKNVRVAANFRGSWLFKYHNLIPSQLFKAINVDFEYLPPAEKVGGYTANDYFILTRAGLKRTTPVPGNQVPPDFTISYRGYIQTWVYRGDTLAKYGISFGPRQ